PTGLLEWRGGIGCRLLITPNNEVRSRHRALLGVLADATQTVARPHRSQAPEILWPVKQKPTHRPSRPLSSRKTAENHCRARRGRPRRPRRRRPLRNPLQRFITGTPKVGSNAGPEEAHVQAERVAR